MSLSEVFKMGFNFMFVYPKSKAWNENKEHLENNATIMTNVQKQLNSIIKLLSGR